MTGKSKPTCDDTYSRMEICPKCAANVPIQNARTYPGLLSDLASIVSDRYTKSNIEQQFQAAIEMACPNCGTRFQSEQIRLLGFLTPKQLRTLLTLIILGIITVVVVTLITDLSK